MTEIANLFFVNIFDKEVGYLLPVFFLLIVIVFRFACIGINFIKIAKRYLLLTRNFKNSQSRTQQHKSPYSNSTYVNSTTYDHFTRFEHENELQQQVVGLHHYYVSSLINMYCAVSTLIVEPAGA